MRVRSSLEVAVSLIAVGAFAACSSAPNRGEGGRAGAELEAEAEAGAEAEGGEPGEPGAAPARGEDPPATEAPPDAPPELQPLVPRRSYRGVVRTPSASRVIRDQSAYEAFVAQIPEKVVTKGPARNDDSGDPLLALPKLFWDEEMLIVGTCDSFYCRYDFEGWRVESEGEGEGGDEVVVLHATSGEPGGYDLHLQRPVRAGGGDAVGHYTALVVALDPRPHRFEERAPVASAPNEDAD